MFSSCKKNSSSYEYPEEQDFTTVYGIVMDVSTLQPISESIVKIYKGQCPGAFGVYGSFLEDTVGPQGGYYFHFNQHKDTCYNLVAESKGYYGIEGVGSSITYPMAQGSGQEAIKKGFENNMDIYLVPIGWLKLRIVNENKLYQSISFNKESPDGTSHISFSGLDLDTTILTRKYGNYSNVVAYFSGVKRIGIDTIFVEAHDTTAFTILY
tara:strand:+ start:722 stop:1351 length:630 start_codon:yes stop_codon:yes gene_type:complete